jgi:hypothetical protein
MAIKRKIVVEKKKEKPAVPIKETAPLPRIPGVVTVQAGTKFRRLKDNGVNKVKRFERDLTLSDRDTIIHFWNDEQHLIKDDDPACAKIAEDINSSTSGRPLSSMQVAGYLSYLCRLGQWTAEDRKARIDRSMRQGRISVRPAYTQRLINEIIENWERERADERERARVHAAIRTARAAGKRVRLRSENGITTQTVITPVQTPTLTPDIAQVLEQTTRRTTRAAAPVEEETFDIKWM